MLIFVILEVEIAKIDETNLKIKNFYFFYSPAIVNPKRKKQLISDLSFNQHNKTVKIITKKLLLIS